MSFRKTLIVIAAVWLIAITLLHATLNLNWFIAGLAGSRATKFRVGYLPVTCHLACPVTDFIKQQMAGEIFSTRCVSMAGRN